MKTITLLLMLFITTTLPSQVYTGAVAGHNTGAGVSIQHHSFYSPMIVQALVAHNLKEKSSVMLNTGVRFTRIASEIDFVGKIGGKLEYVGDFENADLGNGDFYDVTFGPGAGILLDMMPSMPVFFSLDVQTLFDLGGNMDLYGGFTVGLRLTPWKNCENK